MADETGHPELPEPGDETEKLAYLQAIPKYNAELNAALAEPFQILTEYRTRKQGGKLFHIKLYGCEVGVLNQKEALQLAHQILRIAKEK